MAFNEDARILTPMEGWEKVVGTKGGPAGF